MSILHYCKEYFVKTVRISCSKKMSMFYLAIIFSVLFLIPSTGFTQQTIDIANIFPEQLLDLAVAASQEGPQGNKGYGFSKQYALPGEEVKPNSYIGIVLAELSRQALRNDRLGPGVTKTKWQRSLQQAIDKAPPGTPDEEINSVYRAIESGGWSDNKKSGDGFRVVMEVNRPGKRLIGLFRFYNYMCYVDSIGPKYATYEYFDEAFRLILERLGWLK